MINLLYPENYEPNGKILGEKAIESLELKYIAKLICPYNTDIALKVLVELVIRRKRNQMAPGYS